MHMYVLGGDLAEGVDVDVHGLFVEGQPFTMHTGKVPFAGHTVALGYTATGTGRIVGDKLIANVMIDHAPFSLIQQSGDASQSRWILIKDHTYGLVRPPPEAA